AREAQLADEGAIDATLIEAGLGPDPPGLLAGDPAGEADRVATEVPHRAAAHRRIDPGIVGIRQEEREGAAYELERSQLAGSGQLDRAADLGVVQVHEALDGDPARQGRGGGDCVDLGDRERERLLAQDMLASLEGAD